MLYLKKNKYFGKIKMSAGQIWLLLVFPLLCVHKNTLSGPFVKSEVCANGFGHTSLLQVAVEKLLTYSYVPYSVTCGILSGDRVFSEMAMLGKDTNNAVGIMGSAPTSD